jgi:hypothetical protein
MTKVETAVTDPLARPALVSLVRLRWRAVPAQALAEMGGNVSESAAIARHRPPVVATEAVVLRAEAVRASISSQGSSVS